VLALSYRTSPRRQMNAVREHDAIRTTGARLTGSTDPAQKARNARSAQNTCHGEGDDDPGGLRGEPGPEVGGVRFQERPDRERDDVPEGLRLQERSPRAGQEDRTQLPEAVHGADQPGVQASGADALGEEAGGPARRQHRGQADQDQVRGEVVAGGGRLRATSSEISGPVTTLACIATSHQR
jgi:hypothetical protein